MEAGNQNSELLRDTFAEKRQEKRNICNGMPFLQTAMLSVLSGGDNADTKNISQGGELSQDESGF